jgi:hypothetical protein
MYSHKTIPAGRPSSLRRVSPDSQDAGDSPAGQPRSASDDWAEESNSQAAALAAAGSPSETGIFAEFRRKLAMGEALSRAFARLAEALRFSGRITVSFHQGRITKTVFEELHIRSTKATEMSP